MFEGTILDGAIMVYVDGVPIPMVKEDYDKFYDGEYFRNIITGEIYHIHDKYASFFYIVGPRTIDLPYDTKKEPLISFLTKEKGIKVMNGNFTDLDAWNFSQRVATESKQSKSK